MKFTISNWYKQIFLSIALINIFEYTSTTIPTQAGVLTAAKTATLPQVSGVSRFQGSVARKISGCQRIAANYREIYSFETRYHYINICQRGGSYYYYRQSKLEPRNNLLIPAQPVFGGDVFQAIKGRTVYFVGKNGDRYYSSVMQNKDEMIFEPELIATPTFAKKNLNSEIDFSFSQVKVGNFFDGNNQPEELTASAIDKNQSDSSVCIQEESTLNSRWGGWQNLLGKSYLAANMYALNRGHHFVYNHHTPEQALIKTKEGTIVNLGIAANSKTIEEVCIQPIEDN